MPWNGSVFNGGVVGLIPAWEIPWTEEPGRLQSKGSQKEWDMTQ